MKKAVPYILFGGLFVYLIIVLTFAGAKWREVKCKGIQVVVDDTGDNAFIEEEDVLGILKRGYGDMKDQAMAGFDKDSMERILVKNPVIKSAQVYYSLDGYFHVGITQRKPVLRVMAGESYYVDEDGKVMPLSGKYTSRVVVATGNISKEFACEGLYPFVMALREDKFWDALVEQIVVEKGNEVVLIPKVGNFRIVLGTLDRMERKLENLRLFLRKGITLKGWNVYKEINLKFEGQVVCVKR
ncbi:MAG: cell division protein FtsQ [Odoribacter sp.]|nr:cell division protein FtsQ [Odoribacter sp.]